MHKYGSIVADLLKDPDLDKIIEEVSNLPPKKVINALLPKLLSADEVVKWRAVTIGGVLIARLADSDMASARIFIRRLIWQLTDESGGCPFGAPELMAEAMANNRSLADEYANILISYIIPDGNYLEFEPLQRGAVWGIGRLAEVYPDLVRDSVPYLNQLLNSRDVQVREYTRRALEKIQQVSIGT